MLGFGDWVLLGLIGFAVAAALRQMHRAKKSGKSCCGSCSGCTRSCAQAPLNKR